MKGVFLQLSFAFCLVTALSASTFAQQKPSAATVASSSCNHDAALEMIQQQLAETKTFNDEVERITALLRAADLLWPYKLERSRAAYLEAFELATENFKAKGDEPQMEGVGMAITTPDMRFTVITAISKRDLAWAKKLMDQLLNDQLAEAREKNAADPVRENRTAEKLLSTATQVLAKDQAAALSFAIQSLRFPATMHLPLFLYELAEVNQAAGDQFYQSALAAYSKAPMNRLLYLSSYPFGNDREVGEMPGYTVYDVPKTFTPNPLLQRLFVQLLLNRAQQELARPSNPVPQSRITDVEQLWLAFSRLEIQIGQSMPELVPQVAQARINLAAQLPETSQRQLTNVLNPPKGPQLSFVEKVEAAEKNPNVDARDQALVFAVMGASSEEELELILRAVNKISDSKTRGQLLNWLYFGRTTEAIRQKQLINARSLAAKVEELDQRSYLYLRIAEESLKESLDQTQAREMLEEVVNAAMKSSATMVSARTLLGVANLYTKIDPVRAIAVLSDAVKTINGLEAPDFSRQFILRRIEGKNFGSYAAFHTPGFNPESAFKQMAKSDFDGTIYQASNFANKSLRTLITLAVIEPCLDPSKQRGKATPKAKPSKP